MQTLGLVCVWLRTHLNSTGQFGTVCLYVKPSKVLDNWRTLIWVGLGWFQRHALCFIGWYIRVHNLFVCIYICVCSNIDSAILKCDGGIQSLVSLLATDNETVADHLLTVLVNMGTDDQLRAELICCDVIPALVNLLSFEYVCKQLFLQVLLCLLL